MKATWKTLNQLLNKRPNSTSVNNLNVDGKENLQKDAIADSINKYIC